MRDADLALSAATVERALLGDCLIDAGCAKSAVDILTTSDFIDPENRKAFDAIARIVAVGEIADIVSVSAAGIDMAVLAGMIDTVQTTAAFRTHLGRLLDASRRRKLRSLGARLAARCDNPDHTTGELLDEASRVLAECSRDGARIATDPRIPLDEFRRRVAAWPSLPLLATGIGDLDAVIGGVLPGEVMSIVGGDGSMKTSLALRCAEHYLDTIGRPVLYVSLDMEAYRIALRRVLPLLDMAEIPAVEAMQRKDARVEMAMSKRAELDAGRFHIVDGPHDLAAVRRIVDEVRPGVVILDYLTALDGYRSEIDAMREFCRALRKWKRELGCSWLILNQMSEQAKGAQRQGEIGTGRASGGNDIARVSDVGIEMFKDLGDDEPDEDDAPRLAAPARMVATVFKCRHGSSGASFSLEYVGRTMTFTGFAQRVARQKEKKSIFKNAAGW